MNHPPPPVSDAWAIDGYLLATCVQADENGSDVDNAVREAVSTLGISGDRRTKGLLRLYDDGMIRASVAQVDGMGNRGVYIVDGPTPEGLRTVGAWPTPDQSYVRLVAAIERQIQEANEEEASRLQTLLEAAKALGPQVVGGLVSGAVGGIL